MAQSNAREGHDVELRQNSGEDEKRHEFQFINIGSSSNLQKDSKARIRAHAMRDFHRRKLKQQASGQEEDKAPAGSPATPADIAKQTLKFRLGPWGLQQRPTHPRALRQKRPPQTLPVRSAAAGCSATESSVENAPFRKSRPLTPRADTSSFHPPTLHTNEFSLFTQTAKEGTSEVAIAGAPHVDYPAFLPSWDTNNDLPTPDTLQYDPGSGQGDPFNSMPHLASRALQNLLYYLTANRQVSRPSIMAVLRKDWLLMATTDPAFCHAALSQYSGGFGMIQRFAGFTDPLPHISEAIKIVNARLGDPDLAICDGTIGAVACIVNCESANGSPLRVQTHMNGLKQMVMMRGGLHGAGFPTSLRRKIAWADINSASVLLSDPLLPAIDCPNRSLLLGNFSPELNAGKGFEPSNPYENLEESLVSLDIWSKETSSLFVELRHLGDLFASNHFLKLPEMDCIMYSDWVYSIKRRLLSTLNISGSEFCRVMQVEAICCTSAFIVVETCFRSIHLKCRVMQRFVTRQQTLIKPILEDVSFLIASPSTAKALLWALFITGTAASKVEERQWFMTQLAWFCWFSDIKNWKSMEVALKDIFWQPKWEIILPYRELWSDVESAIEMRLDGHNDITVPS